MPGKRWSAAEKEKLQQAIAHGTPLAEIRLVGRTAHAIRAQAIRVGWIEPKPPRWNWSLRQRRLLKKYWRLGFKPEEIHEHRLLGEPYRSLWSIKKKWGRMQLADRRRSRKMRRKKVWQAGEKQAFLEYLVEHSDHMTPEEIGKVWDVARGTVARWQTELGVKRTREAVMQMEYSLAKQRRARDRIRRNNFKAAERRRADREAHLQALAAKLRRQCTSLRERTCTDCARSWPLRSAFFHPADKQTDMGTTRYYKHRCRLCENARRRKQDRKRRAVRRGLHVRPHTTAA